MAKASAGSLREYRRKRDFAKTTEPAGKPPSGKKDGSLRFVIQKHDASRLHYDLRLEMNGVMRSWAVPKGPSLNPADRRLAMEVEDHPIEYNDFEGTIPAGEYGGGTVMLWDRGTYVPDEVEDGSDPEKAVLEAYRDGKLSVTFQGDRLHGSFALVRTQGTEDGKGSKWLLIKHRDEHAAGNGSISDESDRSVASGRTMAEIAAGKGGSRVWHSDRGAGKAAKGVTKGRSRNTTRKLTASGLKPMLATSGHRVPTGKDWIFEPKYDGIRVLAFATPDSVALISRNGYDKATQFPEIAAALAALVESAGEPFVVDGEIVSLVNGSIGRFEKLQSRMHLSSTSAAAQAAEADPAAIVTFDLLLRGDEVLVNRSWKDRRERLETLVSGFDSDTVLISETSMDREALTRRARREGWEGLIAKRRNARYQPGQRSLDWLKLKLENRQEFVVGGWTEPRRSRPYLGAILLGYYDDEGKFIYAGHTGTGFTGDTLAEMHRRLKRLERKTPPFSERPRTNERPHWTTPRVVVEVKFNEWTREGKLRQPVFIGIRDDKDHTEVRREPSTSDTEGIDVEATDAEATNVEPTPVNSTEAADRKTAKQVDARKARSRTGSESTLREDSDPVVARLLEIAAGSGEGELRIGRSGKLSITSMSKVFFPQTGHTKGDLLLYYARMADLILPWMRDRALVLKRFPNGVEDESFYQQAAPESVPSGVRVEKLEIDRKKQERLVGGNLVTLLYTIQLGAISYDPWHSRIQSLDSADYTILDLDPGPGADFRRVIEVARWVKEEMDELGLQGAIKTSGSRGIHIYIPLVRKTPLDAATLIARIIATRVAEKHPKEATVERMTRKRPKGTVYVDFLQNILGKTVAGVYAVRARAEPTVSTPIAWDELESDLDLKAFTLDTLPERVKEVGDLWAPAMEKPNSLRQMLKDLGAKVEG